jgi:hypothetical protein
VRCPVVVAAAGGPPVVVTACMAAGRPVLAHAGRAAASQQPGGLDRAVTSGLHTQEARRPAVAMTGRPRPRRDAQSAPDACAAEIAPAAEIEVTFTPAEPRLTPAAARAVLALLLQARNRAGDAGQRRT